jgi:uncharacterized protein YcfL
MLLPVLLGVLALAACNNSPEPVNTVERANERADPDLIESESVIFDRSLGRSLGLVRVNETTVSENLVKAQVVLQNRTTKVIDANYQWEWYDDAGMLIHSPMRTFKPVRLRGGERVALTNVAPTPRAVDFRFKITEAR